MKLNKEIKIEILKDYGFDELTKEYKDENGFDEYLPIYSFSGYIYKLGHSRRGQYYYLICSVNGHFSLYASEPDGSGASIGLHEKNDIFYTLIKDEIVIP